MFYKNVEIDDYQRLLSHREVWRKKPALNYFYSEALFKKIKYYCNRLPILEVGSGPGFLKNYWKDIVSSDAIPVPWLDMACRCEELPFRDSTFASLVCIDVFHHLAYPLEFLKEAERVVVPEGKIIMIEPWMTPISHIFYKYIHHELCEKSRDPWGGVSRKDQGLFDGNVYLTYQCFNRKGRTEFETHCPNLRLKKIELLGVFVYFLTGGFQPNLGIKSKRLMNNLFRIEKSLEPLFSSLCATRALIVIENLK